MGKIYVDLDFCVVLSALLLLLLLLLRVGSLLVPLPLAPSPWLLSLLVDESPLLLASLPLASLPLASPFLAFSPSDLPSPSLADLDSDLLDFLLSVIYQPLPLK